MDIPEIAGGNWDAGRVLFKGKAATPNPTRVPASAWFERDEAYQFDVFEQSMRIGQDVLSIITISDEDMLVERSGSGKRW